MVVRVGEDAAMTSPMRPRGEGMLLGGQRGHQDTAQAEEGGGAGVGPTAPLSHESAHCARRASSGSGGTQAGQGCKTGERLKAGGRRGSRPDVRARRARDVGRRRFRGKVFCNQEERKALDEQTWK